MCYRTINEHRPYFTFRLGAIWGLVLDCGEDKADSCEEYGNTICCEHFRRKETEFIKSVIQNAEKEYAAPGVKNRIVISHNPFTQIHRHPFDIEQQLYAEWCALLNEYIKPQLLICGHMHECYVTHPADENDAFGQSFPTVVAAIPRHNTGGAYTGGAFTISPYGCDLRFTDSDGKTELSEYFDFTNRD